MPRVLVTDVHVAGQRFAAGTTPPEQYARRITNPAAWKESDVTSPSPTPTGNDNDTSQVGPDTKVVAAPPTGPDSPAVSRPGPEPAEQPESGGAGTGPQKQDGRSGEPPRLTAPPRSGKGSGVDAWQAFAHVHGVAVADGADRAEIVQACEDAGLIDPA